MKTKIVILVALLATTLSPLAGATDTPTCADATDPDAILLADKYYVDVGLFGEDYTFSVFFWNEDNGEPGLQKVDCIDANGRIVLADSGLNPI